MVKIFLNDILYIEGFSDYIKIITGSKPIVTKHLISSLEETLPKENFIRIHRSFIISINNIDSFSADMIQIGNKILPIDRLYKQNVNLRLQSKSNSYTDGHNWIFSWIQIQRDIWMHFSYGKDILLYNQNFTLPLSKSFPLCKEQAVQISPVSPQIMLAEWGYKFTFAGQIIYLK
jgi:LytTr DNA-binding domain